MTTWNTIATQEILEKTVAGLKERGITAMIVENGEEAKKKVLEMIPEKAEVMTMSSVTIDNLGISKELNESGKYNSVKQKLNAMDRKTQSLEMQKLGAASEWAVGSVHAVTEDGVVVVASNTGSQMSGYVYGSAHVVWVVGAQKIVKNLDDAMKRIYDYVLPLESERLKKVYGVPSNVSKLLIFNKEVNPTRITMILVKEALGY